MACEAADVEHRGLHALRHSFALSLYARGVEVKIISKLPGHASVEKPYNRTSIHFFDGRHRRYPPAGSWCISEVEKKADDLVGTGRDCVFRSLVNMSDTYTSHRYHTKKRFFRHNAKCTAEGAFLQQMTDSI